MRRQEQFTFAILGGGGRGKVVSDWIAQRPDAGKVIAIAEPNLPRRQAIATLHGIEPRFQFERWEDLLAQPRVADVLINTLMDRLHAPAGVPALAQGYHMLLEKPMATTLRECQALDSAARKYQRIVSVCHSLRYHNAASQVKQLVTSGAIGELVTLDLIEGVVPEHQAHSFVRGNWGNEDRSTFMLLAKSCHDMDFLAWLVDKPCRRVASFGSLTHFRAPNAPAGAPQRCTDGCPVEAQCPYSALRLYVHPHPKWYADHVGLTGKTTEQRLEAMRTGPYGRCVYHCDNDVVDHQVVSLEFDGQVTGTFTMTAFDDKGRRLRLHGTEGVIEASMETNVIRFHRFLDRVTQEITVPVEEGSHSGGDHNLMVNFMHALRANDPNAVLTTTAQSLASHKIAFAAEMARRDHRVVELSELDAVLEPEPVVADSRKPVTRR
ncbi:MAG: Gfo/Idh/MocA family oxidoreductase [Phycisphaeraceae bacterium]